MQQKEIINLKPFNEVFYKTCMYNPILSAIYYYGGNINPFLANDLFVYAYNEDTNQGLKIWRKNIQIKTEKEILSEMGFCLDTDFGDDYITGFRQAIIDKKPIFITIDRYYWDSIQNAPFFKINHWPHYFLIIGFDDSNRTFKVIDVDAQKCSEFDIDYDNLILSYEEGIKLGGNFVNMPLCKIYPKENAEKTFVPLEMVIENFKEILIKYKEEIFEGIDNIKKAVEFYKTSYNDHDLILSQDRATIAQNFFFFEQAKKVELYRVIKLLGEESELADIMKKILSLLGITRGMFLKAITIKKNIDKTIDIICKNFEEIYNLELKFNKLLFKELDI